MTHNNVLYLVDLYRNNLLYNVKHNERRKKLTTLLGSEVVTDFPISDTARSSSGGGFSLNTSLPFVASSGSSGSLRLSSNEKGTNNLSKQKLV